MSNCKCRFSLKALIEMKNNRTEFRTAAGRRKLWIAEVDEVKQTIKMQRSTGKITWRLKYEKLEKVYKRIHSGEVSLGTKAIDKIIPTWGNYSTGLFNHFGCDKGC